MAPSTRRASYPAIEMAKRIREFQMKRSRASKQSQSSRATKAFSQSQSSKAAKSSKGGKSSKKTNATDMGGLKLLKRGCVTMCHIVRRRITGKKLTVQFNHKGEPIGKAAKEMQSYIGVLARKKIPISIPSWKDVEMEAKNKIWLGVYKLPLPMLLSFLVISVHVCLQEPLC